jgi:hypothetical protein
MNAFVEGGVTIALAVVGLGIISVLVSRNANTAGDIQSLSSGFGNVLGVAQSPVTGTHVPLDLGYPNSGGGIFGS